MYEAKLISDLVAKSQSVDLVIERRQWNVDGTWKMPSKSEFWDQLVLAILSSQQPSGHDSHLDIFSRLEPFPLALVSYERLTDAQVEAVIKEAGLRMGATKTEQMRKSYKWLFGKQDGWSKVSPGLERLLEQRNTSPTPEHKTFERTTARFLDMMLAGIGPKQARNVLQLLGLTRYEIPLDSRVSGWLEENLGWYISRDSLSDAEEYEFWLDRLQLACETARVLPTIFDAAAFEVGKRNRSSESRTTCIGYVNRNGQVVIRNTSLPGTDHLQKVYQLGCSLCGNIYGANGTDIFQRKCPNCQSGAKGLSYENA